MQKKGKPFFFKLEPSRLLSALIRIPESERGAWITQVALELESGEPTLPFTKTLFEEVEIYQKTVSERNRTAGLASAAKRQQMSTPVDDCSTLVNKTQPNSSSNSSTETKEKVKRFVPPSQTEVETYIHENGFDVDPVKWISHYTANGWRVGKNKMVDWKAAVRTWAPKKLELVQPSQKLKFGDPGYKTDQSRLVL